MSRHNRCFEATTRAHLLEKEVFPRAFATVMSGKHSKKLGLCDFFREYPVVDGRYRLELVLSEQTFATSFAILGPHRVCLPQQRVTVHAEVTFYSDAIGSLFGGFSAGTSFFLGHQIFIYNLTCLLGISGWISPLQAILDNMV